MEDDSIQLDIEPIDAESHKVREVYAHFGLAMYHAQCLERILAMALASVYRPNGRTPTKHQLRDLLETNYQKTLGDLVRQLRTTVPIDERLEKLLSEALKKRNWLAHDYFWERAAAFCRSDERKSMVAELDEAADFFLKVDQEFRGVLDQWLAKRGITQEILKRTEKELLEGP